jgi:hypothetical protein
MYPSEEQDGSFTGDSGPTSTMIESNLESLLDDSSGNLMMESAEGKEETLANVDIDSDAPKQWESDGSDEQHQHQQQGPLDPRAARKAAKKQRKMERRAQLSDPSRGQKKCALCDKSVNLLIRCTIDETATWKMACGSCWNKVSGGVADGDADHPHYRYGGLWKNRAKQR